MVINVIEIYDFENIRRKTVSLKTKPEISVTFFNRHFWSIGKMVTHLKFTISTIIFLTD